VRQAFAHLIDKRILVRRVFQQFAIPATTPLPPHIPGFNPKIPSRPYDLGRARALLRLAGVSSGLKCHIIFLEGDPGEQKIVDGFVRNAKKIGIDLRKMPLPFIGIIKALKAGDFELVLRGWIAGPDPDIFLFSNFTMAPGNTNWARFTTPDLSSLLVRARETMGHSERMALYRRIQTIIHKEVPWIPLYHLKYLTIHKRGLKDIYRDSNGFIQFKDTRVESR
jgi:ABC-type transport system substrate-binding protein